MNLANFLSTMSKPEIMKLANRTCEHGHNLLEHHSCLKKTLENQTKIAILDIETSGLEADFSYVISYCFKELSGKIITRTITKEEILSGKEDYELMKDFVKDFIKFDRIVTYFGKYFDIPYLRTRAAINKIDFPTFNQIKHTDLYFIVKSKFKIHRRNLASACDIYDIGAKHHPLKRKIWTKARIGDKKALDYITTHNIEDVVSTEKLFNKIIPYSRLVNSSI